MASKGYAQTFLDKEKHAIKLPSNLIYTIQKSLIKYLKRMPTLGNQNGKYVVPSTTSQKKHYVMHIHQHGKIKFYN